MTTHDVSRRALLRTAALGAAAGAGLAAGTAGGSFAAPLPAGAYTPRYDGMTYEAGDSVATTVSGQAAYDFRGAAITYPKTLGLPIGARRVWMEATAYVGEEGRTAFRLETEYDVLLTQKLVLQPRTEANFYGKKDPARALGHGLSDLSIGLRLRYEIWRELAPYIGIEWAGRFGDTADYLRNAGNRTDEIRAIAGIQFWY